MTVAESNGQEYIECILDKDSFTQKDMITILKSGITLSDYRNKLVRKNTTLNNSADIRIYLPGQWIIADINHQDKYSDSTSYTTNSIDLIATNCVINGRFNYTSPYGKWSTSDIRTYLNTTFKNGFDSEIQELMSQMIVESYFSETTTEQSGGITEAANNNTTDYVKLLSDTELNLSTFTDYMSRTEGTPYSDIFTSSVCDSHNTSRVKESNACSDGRIWWTRSIVCGFTSAVWRVGVGGGCGNGSLSNSVHGVVPVIRLKAI